MGFPSSDANFASENAIVMSINQFSKRNSDEEGLLIQYIDFPIFSKDGDDFDNDVAVLLQP